MQPHKSVSIAFVLLVALVACAARKPGSPIQPGFNMFSKEQDVQLGREAAQQVRQQMPVVKDEDLQKYIRQVGARLSKTQPAGEFPYEFTLLNQKEINAFALPGGPIFVFSGLIRESDNEAQLAGVLAHEIAHVALRHGTNQVSKAQLLQIPAALAGVALPEGALGQVIQIGLGVGLNGLFLKYSRTAENQADALGARIMAEAGYNPIEMARFFEKLEAKGGSGAPEFLSDHPSPGNRVKAVQAEIQTLPQRQYQTNLVAQDYGRVGQEVAQLPEAPAARPQVASANGSGSPGQLQTDRFALSYPPDWQAFGGQGGNYTLAPREGLVQGQGGDVAIGYGAVLGYYKPQSGDLRDGTAELISRLRSSNPGIRRQGGSRQVGVSGNSGLVTTLTSQSPFGGRQETDALLTVERP
jgi:predicted Zn-dependent protease